MSKNDPHPGSSTEAEEPSSLGGKLFVIGIFLAVLALGYWLRENRPTRFAPGLKPEERRTVPYRSSTIPYRIRN